MTRRLGWGLFVAACLAAALYVAGAATLARIQATARADERARLTLEHDARVVAQLAAQRGYYRRIVDSLGAQLATRDSALRTRVAHVRTVTRWMPADTAPAVQLAACRAQLDTLATDCETFRAQAAATIAQLRAAADSAQRADSTAAAAESMRAVLATAQSADFARRLSQATTGRAWARGACAVSVGLNLFTLWRATK